MSELELAWAAGFYDGEGGVHMNRAIHKSRHNKAGTHQYIYPNMGVTQKDPRPLYRFIEAVGLGKVQRKHSNWECHEIKYTSWKDVATVLDLLWIYLSEPKKEQAEKIMGEFLESRKTLKNRTW